jgi:predicted nucleotidyltransferase
MPTALELSREELQIYVDAHRKRVWPTLTAEQEAEREAKIELARRVARMLRKKYAASRVILFGSLAHRSWYHDKSDIDLAAEGLGSDYFKAWGDAEQIVDGRKIDLIDMEMASDSFRQAIEEEGIELL